MTKSFTITITIFLELCAFTAFSHSMRRPLDIAQSYNTFKSWLSEFNKQYGIEEMAVRYYNWKSNLDFVQEHNSKDLPFKLGMNHFADMTPEEFSALHLGYNHELGKARKNHKKNTQNTTNSSSENHNETALPKSVDWRKAGAVTPVKNQSTCGSCWAFSSVAALEGLHAINNKFLANFSEQQLIDCSDDYGNEGCSGGLMTNAFNYTQDHGIELEADYEYIGENDTCKYDSEKVAFKNTGFKEVAENNSLALKAAVALQPVSVGIEASSMTIQLFKSGVITSGCSTDLDHAVVAVGYDTDANGTEYWILKNSWSYKWGLNGFFHIAMGSQNSGAGVCGINMNPAYPTL